ncbi:MAG TPA: rod shape-determining protein MreD [Thermoleophilaceae bacterium]|nr:rod shape-determining protein MreD [Thermoleophilaceae bacterium]
MILTPGTVCRLVLLVIFTVVIQVSGIESIPLLGGTIDLIPLVVGAVALWGGSIAGAAVGFSCGLLLDFIVGQDVGASSLVLTGVGYFVGRYGEVNEPANALLPIPVGAATTAAYLIGTTIVSLMLSFDASLSILAFRDMFLTIFLNTLVALPVFALVRKIIRPVLTRDPLDRRRKRAAPIESGPIGLRGLGL